jgi:hypothetical protein
MKALENFAKANGFKVDKIKYRHKTSSKTGYDIVKGKYILMTFEPVKYSNGDKWLVKYSYSISDKGLEYLKSISAAWLKNIQVSKLQTVYIKK